MNKSIVILKRLTEDAKHLRIDVRGICIGGVVIYRVGLYGLKITPPSHIECEMYI